MGLLEAAGGAVIGTVGGDLLRADVIRVVHIPGIEQGKAVEAADQDVHVAIAALGSFRERCTVIADEYPQELALAVMDHHMQALEDVEDLERAVGRRDLLFFHFALDLALDHFLQAVFALNREYFPSRKRSEIYLQSFQVKPAESEARLHQTVALGGNAETLEQSYKAWKQLVQDLKLLATAQHRSMVMPKE